VALVPRVARAALLLAAILSCSLAGVALAGTQSVPSRFAVGSPGLTLAQNLAIAHWGWSPCNGSVSVVWKRQASDINAMSVWSTLGTDPYGDPQDNQDCEIDLNPAATWDWPKLCSVVVHEYGHLTGHDHDPHPGRLMSAIYTTSTPECATAAAPPATTASRRANVVIPVR
jgi:hypothetical protein